MESTLDRKAFTDTAFDKAGSDSYRSRLATVGVAGITQKGLFVPQAPSSDALSRTPLHDAHRAFGARMVEFAGWSMPISYTGIQQEHQHTRTACSVFDVSHMGRVWLTGKDCESFLNRICTRNLAGAEVGRSYYTHICKEDAGILDDVIVSRDETAWGMVCNASNRAKIIAWLEKQRGDAEVKISDQTTATAMIAIQGPQTIALAEQITGQTLNDLKRYHFRHFDYLMTQITVYRSGYTGEDGLEVVLPAGAVGMLLPFLLGTPDHPHSIIKLAGLGARDTLRLEAGMPLYGHELSEDVDSLTAGQSWCVDLKKDFIGAAPLRKYVQKGLPYGLVGLELEGRRIARQHASVYGEGREIGEVTSGTLSPTLGKSIALAFVAARFNEPGTTLEIEISDKRVPARVVGLPFYKKSAVK